MLVYEFGVILRWHDVKPLVRLCVGDVSFVAVDNFSGRVAHLLCKFGQIALSVSYSITRIAVPEAVVDALDPGIDSQRTQLLAVGLLILPNLAVPLFKGFQPRGVGFKSRYLLWAAKMAPHA